MAPRNLAAPGLSYVDANAGRVGVYTFSAEVLAIKRQVEETWPELQVLWDHETREHLIIEHCRDGTDRLVLTTRNLTGIMDRLMKADCARQGQEDPFVMLEKEEKELQAAMDKELSEKIQEAGERLAFAFAQDGVTVRPRMAPLSTKLKRRKALPNFEAPARARI